VVVISPLAEHLLRFPPVRGTTDPRAEGLVFYRELLSPLGRQPGLTLSVLGQQFAEDGAWDRRATEIIVDDHDSGLAEELLPSAERGIHVQRQVGDRDTTAGGALTNSGSCSSFFTVPPHIRDAELRLPDSDRDSGRRETPMDRSWRDRRGERQEPEAPNAAPVSKKTAFGEHGSLLMARRLARGGAFSPGSH
jgi:hypothetical protein